MTEFRELTADGGVDGILRRGEKICLLQCKRVDGTIGEPVLRDLMGAITHFHAHEGIVVTTGRFSEPAKRWASGKAINLVDIDELTSLVREHFGERNLVPDSFVVELEDVISNSTCPECGKKLKTRTGVYGKFIGCTAYPACTYTRKRKKKR